MKVRVRVRVRVQVGFQVRGRVGVRNISSKRSPSQNLTSLSLAALKK